MLPNGDAEVVEGNWDDEGYVHATTGAEFLTVELLPRSCATCPELVIWFDAEPASGDPVNVPASRLAGQVVHGKALITGIGGPINDWNFVDLDTDELLRLAARVVLAKHNVELEQGEAHE